MSFSVSAEGAKHEVVKQIEQATTTGKYNEEALNNAVVYAASAVEQIPTHLAGAKVNLSGHADEHSYSVNVSVVGMHLMHRTTDTDAEQNDQVIASIERAIGATEQARTAANRGDVDSLQIANANFKHASVDEVG